MERRRTGGARAGRDSQTIDAIRRPPLRIRFRHEPAHCFDGHPTVELGPVGAAPAVAILLAITHPNLSTLLVDARRTLGGRGGRLSRLQHAVFERCGLSRSLALDTTTLAQIAPRLCRRATIARVDGPIDHSDATALERAIVAGSTPIDAELRTVCILQVSPLGSVWSQWRSIDLARSFVAHALSSYLSQAVGLPAGTVPPASSELLLGLPREGCTIRPHEVVVQDNCLEARVRSGRGIAARVVHDLATGKWATV